MCGLMCRSAVSLELRHMRPSTHSGTPHLVMIRAQGDARTTKSSCIFEMSPNCHWRQRSPSDIKAGMPQRAACTMNSTMVLEYPGT